MTRLSSQPFLFCLRAEMDPQVLGNPSGLLHSGHQLIFFFKPEWALHPLSDKNHDSEFNLHFTLAIITH